MKILHITNNYPTTNYPIYGIFVKEQIGAIALLGNECDIVFINGREKGKKEYIFAIPKIIAKILSNKYDLVHCHHVYSGIVFLLGFGFIKKSILSYQNPPEFEGGVKLFRLLRLFFNKIIFKHYKSLDLNIEYLPNGVDTDFFLPMNKCAVRKLLNLDENKIYVLFTDSNNKKRTQKRIDRFTATINILQNRNEKIEPIILTNTKREEMPLYFNAVDVHLITSDFEGSPNSVKECLACNTPVVSTPVGNVADMISEIPGCFVSNSFNPAELSLLVEKAINYNNFCGRDYLINKKLTKVDITNQLLAIYKNVINN